jgi:SAM-dependent methyltransferase
MGEGTGSPAAWRAPGDPARPYAWAVRPPTRARSADFYRIPEIYDILHAPGTAREVRVLERLVRRYGAGEAGSGGLTWLEPACGTGRYLRALVGRGHRAIGFDLSPEMVEYARADPAEATAGGRLIVFRADMTRFARPLARALGERGRSAPPCVDAAFCLINSLRHLGTDAAVLAHLRQVAGALRPGGVYLVGLSLAMYEVEVPSEDVWEGRRDGVRVQQVVQYEPAHGSTGAARAERVVSHLTVTSGRGGSRRVEHIDSKYTLRSYNREQWLRLLSRCGLEAAAVVDDEGKKIRQPVLGYAVYVLRKGTGPAGSKRRPRLRSKE